MERHDNLEAMGELKLYGRRASFDEIAGKGLVRRDEIYSLVASLIRVERTPRQARSISCRIGGAKFPVLKDLNSFDFTKTPVDVGQVRELASGAFAGCQAQRHFHRRHRHRHNPSLRRHRLGGHPRPRQGAMLQPGRPGQPA